jgi:hypothetical protein
MIIMTPLLASPLRDLSPEASFWRWRSASKKPCRTRLNSPKSEKIHDTLRQKASGPSLKSAAPSARARNRYRPALTPAFKSP